jgi:hypothetical protein
MRVVIEGDDGARAWFDYAKIGYGTEHDQFRSFLREAIEKVREERKADDDG